MLQALNILEDFDLKGMGYNSARYINTIYQAMNLAFADRDFYYGDPYFPPAEPIRGLLSKDYAKERVKLLNKERNDPAVAPGDPYPFQGEVNPYRALLEKWNVKPVAAPAPTPPANQYTVRPPTQAFAHRSSDDDFKRAFYAGTTSVEAADEEGCRFSDAQRRLGAGSDRGTHRCRTQPTRSELCNRSGRWSFQRYRTRQTSTRHAYAHVGIAGRQTFPLFFSAGRRQSGSKSASVLFEYC